MLQSIDILENEILAKYPNVLEILLLDRTTRKNIFWASENYQHLGSNYGFHSQILPESVSGKNGQIIIPRVKKDKSLQQIRAREMAEVFTPSWVCNAQNNLIDNQWFERDNTFNYEEVDENGKRTWVVNNNKITFPNQKNWEDYIKDTRLEITCGEAPYLTSRYDTTTGEFIAITNRIGMLDRKLRVINENVNGTEEWLIATEIAYKAIFAFEWQGDSLLLAREALLFTFIENYIFKFGKEPALESIKNIAYIISWNVWQMDGLKGIVPDSCKTNKEITYDLLGDAKTTITGCKGCENDEIKKHNGTYCLIKDWHCADNINNKKGKKIRFIDLIKT